MSDPLVSICCLTYNHEAYVRDCLEGFMMQQTNFPFEVLIHDDASTDRTADIIREYEKKYPDIIKPIYQTENQHSKGVRISMTFNFPRVRGKYIAMCEGDDYWTDPLKLQKQFDYMESHPECSLCFHNVIVCNEKTKQKYPNPVLDRADRHYTRAEIIERGCFFQTLSMFFRAEGKNELSVFNRMCPVGDYPLAISILAYGDAYYMSEIMGCYRFLAQSSWSKDLAADLKRRVEFARKMENWLQHLATLLPQYAEIIKVRESKFRISKLLLQDDFEAIKKDAYFEEWLRGLSSRERFKIKLKTAFPGISRSVLSAFRKLKRG